MKKMDSRRIDINTPITREEFHRLTDEMLEKRKNLDKLEYYTSHEIKIEDYVKQDYNVTTNQDNFEEQVKAIANKKYGWLKTLCRLLLFIFYIAFLIIFPMYTEIKIEDGYIFAIPIALLVILSFLNSINIHKADDALYGVLGCTGVIVPVLGILAAIFAAETTGEGDTACLIAYFVDIILALIIPALIFSEERILRNIKNKPENLRKAEEAEQLDHKLADECRSQDEKQYSDECNKRDNFLKWKQEIESEWKPFTDFYNLWYTYAPGRLQIMRMKGFADYFHGEKRLPKEFMDSAVKNIKGRDEHIKRSMELADEVAAEFSEFLTGHR